jgi:hypothetical protein
MTAARVSDLPQVAVVAKASDGAKAVVEQVTIKVAIQVVIKERSMRGQSAVVEAIGIGLFFEAQVPFVDEQFIFFVVALDVAGVAEINIQQAIAIYINHCHAGTPGFFSGSAGGGGDILEFPIAFIEV